MHDGKFTEILWKSFFQAKKRETEISHLLSSVLLKPDRTGRSDWFCQKNTDPSLGSNIILKF